MLNIYEHDLDMLAKATDEEQFSSWMFGIVVGSLIGAILGALAGWTSMKPILQVIYALVSLNLFLVSAWFGWKAFSARRERQRKDRALRQTDPLAVTVPVLGGSAASPLP